MSTPNHAIIHENVTLLEAASKLLLDMLYADPTTRPFLLTRLSETVAVVQTDKFDVLLNRLKKNGHTPKVLER